MYFQQSIDDNKGNPKGIWKALKSLTKSQKSTQFNIPLITVQETQKFIDNSSSSKATGADEISVKVLKLVSPVFVQALTRLINLSIEVAVFQPDEKWRASHLSLKMTP